MCRFLLIKSKKEIQPKKLLDQFSLMCKNNSEWQGDGWGIARRLDNRSWTVDKSVKPIWKDTNKFGEIPKSKIFVVHARGASFPKHKDNIDFNQPYIDDELCFVFNGELYGVTLQAEGVIGSQKIFSLLKNEISITDPKKALQDLQKKLITNSKSILGCNIGFINNDELYASCYFGDKKEYYTLRYYSDKDLSIICSEKIGNYPWKNINKGDVIKL